MIAVIDAGFKNANIIQGLKQSIIGDKDFVTPGGNVYAGDMSNHGTMVLATMAANIPAIARFGLPSHLTRNANTIFNNITGVT